MEFCSISVERGALCITGCEGVLFRQCSSEMYKFRALGVVVGWWSVLHFHFHFHFRLFTTPSQKRPERKPHKRENRPWLGKVVEAGDAGKREK